MDVLADEWRALLSRIVPDADLATVERVGMELLSRWREPHRHYHTADHLAAVLSTVDQLGGSDAVRLAAWYHDAVYDPWAAPPANEEESAALAERELARLRVPPATVAEVARLVRLTAGHAADAGDPDGAVLCDADLAILAADGPAYDAYAAAVRREYAHVPEEAFRLARAAILTQLLALPALFRRQESHTRWEGKARANLHRELTTLT
jgi:predicted metal-dependent HD superfamily phosphohydrolase